MARLVGICRDQNDPSAFRKQQLPVFIDDMRTMIAEFDNPCVEESVGKFPGTQSSVGSSMMSVKQFCQKLGSLTADETVFALSVDYEQIVIYLSQLIPCVGCRRCVEKLFLDLAAMGHAAIDPFCITETCVLTVSRSLFGDHKLLHQKLIGDYSKCQALVENLTKCRKNKRCALHSLENHVCRSKNCWSWEELWELMSSDCRDECCIVEADSLLDMLETYLQKHRFCPECKNKLMRAYNCLVGEVDTSKEKGFNPRLFQGLRYCNSEAHLHLKPCVTYLNSLIERAEAELSGSTRERHAKTLEVGQVEVLTCLGLYMHGRLHRMNTALRTLHASFQLLYCVSVMALNANFQAVIEAKQGLSESFEKLCLELQDSAANPQKQNKGRKKKQKGRSANLPTGNKVPGNVRGKSKGGDSASVCSEPSDVRVDGSQAKGSGDRNRKVSRSQSPAYRKREESCSSSRSADIVLPVGYSEEIPKPTGGAESGIVHKLRDTCMQVSGHERPKASNLPNEMVRCGLYPVCPMKCPVSTEHIDQKDGIKETQLQSQDAGYSSSREGSPGGSPLSTITTSSMGKGFTDGCNSCSEHARKGLVRKPNDSTFETEIGTNGDCLVDSSCTCSLQTMLEACGDDENESEVQDVGCGSGVESSLISPEEIAWFRANESKVLRERQALRQRVWDKFHQLQARLTATAE